MTMNAKQKIIDGVTRILNGPMCLEKAVLVAVAAHAGQRDKGGNSYIRHPLRVMEEMTTEHEMAVAVCHDVVEDTDVTLADLVELGFTQDQVDDIDSLTKRDGELYQESIERVVKRPVAKNVKKRDIKDNMKLWRLKNRKLTNKDFARMQNYVDALVILGDLDTRD